MPLPTFFRRTILLAALAVPYFAQPQPASLARLPSVTSYSLDKAKVTLPEDLAGRQNVLILYFQPDQGEGSVAWETALRSVKYAHPEMQTYILPVYARENWLYRWWVGATLRSSAPPAQEWHSTVPIFVDKPRFLPALGIHTEKQSVVLLTDKSGRVEWRAEGRMDKAKLLDLVEALQQSSPTAGNTATGQ